MEEKTLKISIPDGYEIDSEKSTFENIVFKKKQENSWRNRKNKFIYGYFIDSRSTIIGPIDDITQTKINMNVFATEKQAKSALAMAQISQIMEHDPRFGGPITDEEWNDKRFYKCIIRRIGNDIINDAHNMFYNFLAFHNIEQCDLFIKENLDLVKDYLMIE